MVASETALKLCLAIKERKILVFNLLLLFIKYDALKVYI